MISVQTTSHLTAAQRIYQLAQEHGIVHHHSQLDEWGDTISQLSDHEAELDETQWLLVEFNRAGILTGKDNTLLHAQYLREREA
jgi:hypothetical protein